MFLIFSWGWPSSPRDIWNGRWKLPGSFFQIAGKRCTWQQGWQLVQECIWEVWASNLGCILSGFSQKTSFSHDIFVFFFHHQLRAGNTRGTQCEGDPAKPVIWTLTFWVLFFLFFWESEKQDGSVQTEPKGPFLSFLSLTISVSLYALAWEKTESLSPSSCCIAVRESLAHRMKEEAGRRRWTAELLSQKEATGKGRTGRTGHVTLRKSTNVVVDNCRDSRSSPSHRAHGGTREPLPRDTGNFQSVPAADKYMEIPCCKSAIKTRKKNGWDRESDVLTLIIGKLLNSWRCYGHG